MKEMDFHFKKQINSINLKTLKVDLAENVSSSFKELYDSIFNQFKESFIEMSNQIEENLHHREQKKKTAKELYKQRKISKQKEVMGPENPQTSKKGPNDKSQ